MGKGWAKGLTAATDPRVARAAAGHRGLEYERRTPIDECRWTANTATTLAIEWSDTMAYVVGLTATDGCLITGRRAINFKSGDQELVELYLRLLGRTNKIGTEHTRTGGTAFKTQFSDARLYRWFLQVGLTPRKSLTIGAINVPDRFLMPLARGLLDGDGSVINKTYRADTTRRTDYFWEYLITKFNSASKPHLEWLAARLFDLTGVRSTPIEVKRRKPDPSRHPFFHLRYEKRASEILLPLLYPSGAPCLARKSAIWLQYADRHGLNPSI